MVLNQTINGLLFKDNFTDHNLLWSVNSDNETKYSFSENGLTLKHGDIETTATLSLPTDFNEYSILIEMEHEPDIDGDICGVRLFSLTGDRLSYESYYNDTDGGNHYRYLRINYKSKIYSYQVSNDGLKWLEVGSCDMSDFNELCRLCFFANDNGNEIGSKDLIIKNIYIYSNTIAVFKNTYITNTNIFLTDNSGNNINIPYIIKGKDIIYDCSKVLNDIECNLTLKDKAGNTMFTQTGIVLNAGNVYEYNAQIVVYYNNDPIDNLNEFYLGILDKKDNYIRLVVNNNSTENTIYDKNISIDKCSPYSTGNERTYISICNDTDTNDDYTNLRFDKQCHIDKLEPGESINIVIKISNENKQYIPYYDDNYRFSINII